MQLLKIFRSLLVGICVILYTLAGAALLFLLFPFFGRRSYVDFLTRLWARLILWTGRIKITVEGIENLEPGTAYVFIANHQSLFDIPACIAVIPARLRMLAKKELFRIPVFGWGMWAIGHISIDRENREKAVESVNDAVQRLRRENISPLVYPEGTRSPDGKIHPFKKGAFVLAIQSERPVVPVTIIGSRKILPKKSLIFSPGRIHVIIDKPVATSGMEFSDRSRLAENIHDIIVRRFNEASGAQKAASE